MSIIWKISKNKIITIHVFIGIWDINIAIYPRETFFKNQISRYKGVKEEKVKQGLFFIILSKIFIF